MADSQPSIDCGLEVELTVQRYEGESAVQFVSVSTEVDGTLKVSSTGRLPRLGFRQLIQARQAMQLLARTSGKNVIIEHDGRLFAELHSEANTAAKWSIRWWSLIRYWIAKSFDW
jgi:hypothetical protein